MNVIYVDGEQCVIVKQKYAYHYRRFTKDSIGRTEIGSRRQIVNDLISVGLHRWEWDFIGFDRYRGSVKSLLKAYPGHDRIDSEYVTDKIIKAYFEKTVEPKDAAYAIASEGC